MKYAWHLSTRKASSLAFCAGLLLSGWVGAEEAKLAKSADGAEVVNITGSKVSATGKECIYLNLANLRLKSVNGMLTARGNINGSDEPMVLDTGRLHSVLALNDAKKLSLTLGHANAASHVDYAAYINDIALDRFFWHKVVLGVVEQTPVPNYSLWAGADILLNGLNKDVEISAADGQMKIFVPSGCDNAFLAYWDKDASSVPLVDLSTSDPRQILTVRVNGKEMTAMIDSGSPISIVNIDAAARAGITPTSAGVSELQSGFVPYKQNGKVWKANFSTFSIGNEVIQHPSIAIADLWGSPDAKAQDPAASLRLAFIAPTLVGATGVPVTPSTEAVASIARLSTADTAPTVQPDILLGADFLRAHRVLLAISQRKMYFTYAGGTVFGNLGESAPTVPMSAASQPFAMLVTPPGTKSQE
jgi:hypothetical protein